MRHNNFWLWAFFRFLAKILVPEGSKDVPVGQPIAITVIVSISKYVNIFYQSYHIFCFLYILREQFSLLDLIKEFGREIWLEFSHPNHSWTVWKSVPLWKYGRQKLCISFYCLYWNWHMGEWNLEPELMFF